MSRVLSKTARRRIAHTLSYAFLFGVGLTMLLPLVWMISTSLKLPGANLMDPGAWFRTDLAWGNFRTAVVETRFGRALFNSAVVALVVTFGKLFTSSLAAFAFARLQFPGRDKIFIAYLATMMIPGAVTLIPQFVLLREMRLINTYWALTLPSMFTAWGTFMLRQFFLSIPTELEESAILDGCTPFGVYWHVVLPLSRPGLAALGILVFMGTWKDFMGPLIKTNTPDMYTLPVALATFREMGGINVSVLMAGSVLMMVPMILVFLAGQRHFVSGIRVGALKG
jgi:multiple sugar transport system permease protein